MEDSFSGTAEQFWEGWDGPERVAALQSAVRTNPYDPHNNVETAEEMWADFDQEESLEQVTSRRKSSHDEHSKVECVVSALQTVSLSTSIDRPQASKAHPRLATISLKRDWSSSTGWDVGSTLQKAVKLVEQCGEQNADLVVLPESFLCPVDALVRNLKEKGPAQIKQFHRLALDTLSSLAKTFNMYICFGSLFADLDDNLHNGVHLLSRRGELLASYSKRHPTQRELEAGIMPGEEQAVVATDFGNLALMMSFDVNFPSEWEDLKGQKVDTVCFSGELSCVSRLRSLALYAHVWVVASFCGGVSPIFDVSGSLQGKSSDLVPVCNCVANLSRRLLHIDSEDDRSLLSSLHCSSTQIGLVEDDEELVWVQAASGNFADVVLALEKHGLPTLSAKLENEHKLRTSVVGITKHFL